MDYSQIITIALTTAGTVLGSSALWKFWENRSKAKEKNEEAERREKYLFRDDLRERVAVLEIKLIKADEEKATMQKEMLRLVEKIASLSTEVEFLRKENAELHSKLAAD